MLCAVSSSWRNAVKSMSCVRKSSSFDLKRHFFLMLTNFLAELSFASFISRRAKCLPCSSRSALQKNLYMEHNNKTKRTGYAHERRSSCLSRSCRWRSRIFPRARLSVSRASQSGGLLHSHGALEMTVRAIFSLTRSINANSSPFSPATRRNATSARTLFAMHLMHRRTRTASVTR